MNNPIAYIADGVFTGAHWMSAYAVLVRDGRILSLLPRNEVPAGVDVREFQDAVIAPAFIDVQIYGASGKLFSAYPEPDSLQALVAHNRSGGTALCLPTIATNSNDIYYKAIDAIRVYWDQGGKGVYG
ncbi:MAG: N-acetylglucosamine-6-phosphate deacetylase, partial [Chitinophagaceae bacterium]